MDNIKYIASSALCIARMDVGLFVGYLPLVSQVYYKLHYEIHRIDVATIIELGNHEIFKQSILKFDILINSHIVYSNIWQPYLVKVRMSVAILSHISGNDYECIDMKVFASNYFLQYILQRRFRYVKAFKKLSIFSMMFYKETSELQTPHPQIILAKIMENRKVWAVPLLRFLTLCLLLTFYKKGVGAYSYIHVHIPYKHAIAFKRN